MGEESKKKKNELSFLYKLKWTFTPQIFWRSWRENFNRS